MPKNRYSGLTTNQAIDYSEEEMYEVQERMKDLNNPDHSICKSVPYFKEDPIPYLKGVIFNTGLNTLKNLTQAHFERKKPGFFSMLFRTKEAQEYRAERKQIDRIAEFLTNEKEKNPGMKFRTSTGVLTEDPIDIQKMVHNRAYFSQNAGTLEYCETLLRDELQQKFNASEAAKNAEHQNTLNHFVDSHFFNLDDIAKQNGVNVPSKEEAEETVDREERSAIFENDDPDLTNTPKKAKERVISIEVISEGPDQQMEQSDPSMTLNH